MSAVGVLSVPKECETPGALNFQGPLFHFAKWDHSFDWKNEDVVVLGNGCPAIQFVPIMSGGPNADKRITQFSRQAHYLAERQKLCYLPAFKMVMRYLPFAMRLYRASLYWEMERDLPRFAIEGRQAEVYVKQMAPKKYWDALIPKTDAVVLAIGFEITNAIPYGNQRRKRHQSKRSCS